LTFRLSTFDFQPSGRSLIENPQVMIILHSHSDL
jgi:hypothetical protein